MYSTFHPIQLPVGEIHEVGKREIIKVNNCIDHSHLDQLNTSQQVRSQFHLCDL